MTFGQWLKFQPSERKIRLFVCAAARWLWHGLSEEARRAVECSEQFADGLAGKQELFSKHALTEWDGEHDYFEKSDIGRIAADPDFGNYSTLHQWLANTTACPASEIISCIGGPWVACKRCDGKTYHGPLGEGPLGAGDCHACYGTGRVPAKMTLCGKYHASPVHHVNSWKCADCRHVLNWRAVQQKCGACGGAAAPVALCTHCSGSGYTTTCLLVQTAQTIYDEQKWEDLPILADMLTDASCENQEILRHCREGGPHSRGCWVLDLLLNKA